MFENQKKTLEVIKLQIFIIKKFLRNTCLALISLNSALNIGDNYNPQVFLKEYKYTEKKIITYDNLSDFSFSSDDEE